MAFETSLAPSEKLPPRGRKEMEHRGKQNKKQGKKERKQAQLDSVPCGKTESAPSVQNKLPINDGKSARTRQQLQKITKKANRNFKKRVVLSPPLDHMPAPSPHPPRCSISLKIQNELQLSCTVVFSLFFCTHASSYL